MVVRKSVREVPNLDGNFVSAQKGGRAVGKTKRGKGTNIMAMADRFGLPKYWKMSGQHLVVPDMVNKNSR
jgi:hypothetical protein